MWCNWPAIYSKHVIFIYNINQARYHLLGERLALELRRLPCHHCAWLACWGSKWGPHSDLLICSILCPTKKALSLSMKVLAGLRKSKIFSDHACETVTFISTCCTNEHHMLASHISWFGSPHQVIQKIDLILYLCKRVTCCGNYTKT